MHRYLKKLRKAIKINNKKEVREIKEDLKEISYKKKIRRNLKEEKKGNFKHLSSLSNDSFSTL
ncbi:hypothetical protein [Staphylococcus simulans]|uniref:hypothetical protein n=1 Tax=Staphylococcus simulans TaxID=1286 RepID=UPI003F8196F4